MAGARPEPKLEEARSREKAAKHADLILARLNSASRAADHITAAAQRQTEIARHTEIAPHDATKHVSKAVDVADTAHSIYKLARWTDPLGAGTDLATKAAERLTGHNSVVSRASRLASYGVNVGEAMAGHPVAIGKAVVNAPQAIADTAMLPYAASAGARQEVQQRMGSAKAGLSQVGGAVGGLGLTENMGEDRGERQLGAMGKASEKFLQAGLGKHLGMAASLFVGPPVLFAKLTERLRDFSDHLHNANMRFAEFSGAMQAVQIDQNIREMRLSKERGDRLAGSAAYLAEGKSKLDRDMGNIEDLFSTIKNYGGGLFDRIGHFFMEDWGEWANDLRETIDALAKEFGMNSKKKEIDLEEGLANASDKRWLETYGKKWPRT